MNQARHIDVETLNALVDDAVPDAERQAITRHLADCPTCQQDLRELRAVSLLCAGLPQFTPSRVFTLGPAYQRPARHPRVVHILPVLRSLSIAAVLIFVLLSAFAVINTQQSSASSPDQRAPAPQSRVGAVPPAQAETPAATQPAANQAQSLVPKNAGEGARATQSTTASNRRASAADDRSLSGWWVASLIVGLGTALLLLAWFALDRGGTRRLMRA